MNYLNLQLFKALVGLQGDGSDVYELLEGDLHPRGDIRDCVGDDIIATYEAWAREQQEVYQVNKGSKACFCDDGKHFFHWMQVTEYPDDREEHDFLDWEYLNDDWGDR